ncbi:ABC transporter ATP-binding protein [Demequina sp.]|uniref:ABC transporter ATP-binding protein n=1 Tax=Demequina sp. TaxID=2050685 RepID=UPI003D148A65
MTGLRVSDLTVTYPGRPPVVAVNHVDLEVARGEIVALLGPSGCGKSSLLGAIVGTVEPASGSITFDHEDVTRLPIHRRGFGLVFQDGQLFPHLTVAGNLAYGIPHLSRVEREARVQELLELVGLDGLDHRKVTELSGGQRQRVALARSLAPSPRLLCLDEPLSSLDADLRERLADDLGEVLTASGTTALMVTHDPEEATRVAARVLRMRDGVIAP